MSIRMLKVIESRPKMDSLKPVDRDTRILKSLFHCKYCQRKWYTFYQTKTLVSPCTFLLCPRCSNPVTADGFVS